MRIMHTLECSLIYLARSYRHFHGPVRKSMLLSLQVQEAYFFYEQVRYIITCKVILLDLFVKSMLSTCKVILPDLFVNSSYKYRAEYSDSTVFLVDVRQIFTCETLQRPIPLLRSSTYLAPPPIQCTLETHPPDGL